MLFRSVVSHIPGSGKTLTGSSLTGTEWQWVQKNTGYRGTENTLGTEEQCVQSNGGFKGTVGAKVQRKSEYTETGEHWIQRNSGFKGTVGTEEQ